MKTAALALPLCLTLACVGTLAGTPDKLAEPAGPPPSVPAAQRVVANELVRATRDPADFSRVRFLSGPHLVTGINFAGNREQAWQICVITGDGRLSRGPLDLEVKPYLLRNSEKGLAVVQLANWKDSDVSC